MFQQFIVRSAISSKLVDHWFVHGSSFINVSTTTLVHSLQNDCDVLEKALQLDIFVHPNKESHLSEEYRSRYSKFHTYQYEHKPHVVTPDREPSRLPVKQLTCVMHKSRKIRKNVQKNVVKNEPMSSRVHCFANKCHCNHKQVKYPKSYHRRKPALPR